MTDALHQLPAGPVSELDQAKIEPYLSGGAGAGARHPFIALAAAAVVFLILSLPFWGSFSLIQLGIKLAVFVVALILIKTYLQ